jgi:hypothetical protein
LIWRADGEGFLELWRDQSPRSSPPALINARITSKAVIATS